MIKDHNLVTLAPLTRADGSATYSCNGYTVIGAINGPVEVQRRDELPQEAAVDVVVRPASGVGGVRERHLESIVQSTLRSIILVSAHPRTLIQVTLQIIGTQGSGSASSGIPQSESNLSVLPALLQTATFALLTTSIPLAKTLTSTLMAIDFHGTLLSEPLPAQLKDASSVHVLAFSSLGELLVVESEGDFTFDTWLEVHDKAMQICQESQLDRDSGENKDGDGDVNMGVAKAIDFSKEDLLRRVVQDKVSKDEKWMHTSS